VLAFPTPFAKIVFMRLTSPFALDILDGAWNLHPRSFTHRAFGWGRMAAALILVVSAAGSIDLASAQSAKTCTSAAVMARGEPSTFEWLARTKARANWRHRVRSTPELGTEYSDWKLAANLEESCLVGSDGTVCTITAVPCRQ